MATYWQVFFFVAAMVEKASTREAKTFIHMYVVHILTSKNVLCWDLNNSH